MSAPVSPSPPPRAGLGRLLLNFGFLSAGKLLGDLCTFGMFVVLSQIYGETGIGQYSFAIAFTGFFAVFADYGLYYLGMKNMSWDDAAPARAYPNVLAIRLLLSALVLMVLLGAVEFLPFSDEVKVIVLVIGGFQVLYTIVDGFATIFLARARAQWAALIELCLRATVAGAAVSAALAGAGLVLTLATMPVICLVQTLVAYALVRWHFGRLWPRTSWQQLVRTLREATPYAGSIFLFHISNRTDVVMLGLIVGPAAAGLYNVAYRVIFLLQSVPYLASIVLLPQAARLHAANQQARLAPLYHDTVGLALLGGIPASAGLWLIAPDVIMLIFGPRFAASGAVLRWLSALLLLASLKHLTALFLTACDRQSQRTRTEWYAAGVNVIGNLALIPSFGITGAVVATLCSESVLVVAFLVHLRALFDGSRIAPRLAMSLAGTAVFCLALALLPALSLVLVVLLSMLLYLATLMLFRDFRQHELALVVEFVRGRRP